MQKNATRRSPYFFGLNFCDFEQQLSLNLQQIIIFVWKDWILNFSDFKSSKLKHQLNDSSFQSQNDSSFQRICCQSIPSSVSSVIFDVAFKIFHSWWWLRKSINGYYRNVISLFVAVELIGLIRFQNLLCLFHSLVPSIYSQLQAHMQFFSDGFCFNNFHRTQCTVCLLKNASTGT